MTSLRRLHFTFFFKHAIVNISSGLTRLIRRKCSLNRSKCVGINHVIVYPRCCYYINLITCGAGLSPRDIHCLCLTTSFTYDIEERGRVSANVSRLDFHSERLSEARRPAEQERGSRITRKHDISLADSIDLLSNVSHRRQSWRTSTEWDGIFGRVQVDEVVWTVTLVIIIGRK